MHGDLAQLDRAIAGEIWGSSTIRENLHILCDTIGERWCGTPSEWSAGEFIRDTFREIRLRETRTQHFEHTGWNPVGATLEVGNAAGPRTRWPCLPLLGSPNRVVRAALLDLEDGIPSHYNVARADVAGRIVLITTDCQPPFFDRNYLGLTLDDKYREAAACGAAAVVFTSSKQMGGVLPIQYAWRLHDHPIPHVSVSYEVGERIRRLLIATGGSTTARLETEAVVQPTESFNVIGSLGGGGSANEILVSAHYDGVYGSPAAMDNASGVCVLLEVARVLARHHPAKPNRNIRFIAFAAEEKSLLGSRHYVQSPDIPLDRITLVFTLDTLAAGRMKGYCVPTGTSLEAASALNSVLSDADIPYSCHISPMKHLDDSGDGFPFAVRGVPTISPWRWRYAASRPEHQYVHTPWDTIDKVDVRDLQEYSFELCRFLARLQTASPQLDQQLRIRSTTQPGTTDGIEQEQSTEHNRPAQNGVMKGASDV